MDDLSQPSNKIYLPFRGVKNESTLYTTLDMSSRGIRYVDLRPASGADPVVCSLGHATLDPERDGRPLYSIEPGGGENPVFEALSYCWGSIDDIVPITLLVPTSSGTRNVPCADNFSVTRNLKEALTALRYGNGMRRMWIDAISINQMDDREKTHQVGQMNLIYSMATRVVVWLGLEDRHSSYVFRYHEKFQKKFAVFSLGPQKHLLLRESMGDTCKLRSLTRSLSRSILKEAEAESALRTPSKKYHWNIPMTSSPADIHDLLTIGAENLLDRPWFRRIWVYGEVFLAPCDANGDRLVTVVVGSSSMRWSDLVHLIRAAAMKPFWTVDNPHGYSGSVSNIMWFQQSWDASDDALSTSTLANCVNRTHGFLASDARDKIFALVHLAQDTRDCITTDPRLMPDYEQMLLDIIIKYVGIGIMLISEVKVTPYRQVEDTLMYLDFGPTGRVLLGAEHVIISRKVACVERFFGPARLPLLDVPETCKSTFIATNRRTYAVNCFLAPKDKIVPCNLARNYFVITPYPLKEGTYLVRGPCVCWPIYEKDGCWRSRGPHS